MSAPICLAKFGQEPFKNNQICPNFQKADISEGGLPEGQQLAPHINPQTRTDLLEMERNRYDLICGVLGIPSAFIMNSRGSKISGVNDITYKIFMRSMEGLKSMLSNLLKQVFSEIYQEDSECIVNLPFIPVTDMDDIIKLSTQGVVSRKTIGQYLLKTMGLPESDLDLQPLEVPAPEGSQEVKKDKDKPPPAKKQKITNET